MRRRPSAAPRTSRETDSPPAREGAGWPSTETSGHALWRRHGSQELVARREPSRLQPIGDLLAAPAFGDRRHQAALDLALGQHLDDLVGRHRPAELVVARGQATRRRRPARPPGGTRAPNGRARAAAASSPMSLALDPGRRSTTCLAVSWASIGAVGSASWRDDADSRIERRIAQHEVADADARADHDQREQENQQSARASSVP